MLLTTAGPGEKVGGALPLLEDSPGLANSHATEGLVVTAPRISPSHARRLELATAPPPDLARRTELAADGAMSVEDTAKFMACGRTLVFALIKSGELATTKVRRRRVVLRRSAAEYLAAHADIR